LKPEEHAVIVTLKLSDAAFGDARERDAIHALTDRLDAAIRAAGAGEFDGDEFGDGVCTLYMYGPDADRLFDAIAPELRGSPLTRGGSATRRYGAASNPSARVERVALD
jgi:hypothetical protein